MSSNNINLYFVFISLCYTKNNIIEETYQFTLKANWGRQSNNQPNYETVLYKRVHLFKHLQYLVTSFPFFLRNIKQIDGYYILGTV